MTTQRPTTRPAKPRVRRGTDPTKPIVVSYFPWIEVQLTADEARRLALDIADLLGGGR
ncbi:hypothetical protein SAMN05445060_1977 [Williamsia sterculiae]|uniref:Uncharacterized protein n=1 Tax=Williamsia sterculiae TaxID=1344003 RepID=A0A1N7FDR1_9NOCA|nr:hypothetical protein SAMN05445060_1977 [Williamsia sterculiae]